MKWQKKGLVFAPSGELWWAQDYALLPTAHIINDDVVRVYFATLDEKKLGRIGYVDLSSENPARILSSSREPVLDIGELGAFDDSGVNPSCVLDSNGRKLLYYIGWQRCERVPYMLYGGLATSFDGLKFERASKTPVIDRTDNEPYSRAAPYVLLDEGVFKMWYWSCTKWVTTNGLVHYYNVIRYATSTDGRHWETSDHVCIAPGDTDEYSIGRPCVIKDGGSYQMWYSIRSFTRLYRIGYATSEDGIYWTRNDAEAGIERSPSGWDSEMVCYPYVLSVAGKLHMFYNGNHHGSTGFGYAVLES